MNSGILTLKRGYRVNQLTRSRAAKCLLLLLPSMLPGQVLLREEQTVMVDGTTEVWRLVWKHPPEPACSPQDVDAFTWRCNGFAFGERGQLNLLRLRDDREIDHLALTPLFDAGLLHGREAILQRWEKLDKDTLNTDARVLGPEVHKRPIVTVMNLSDYDHDGASAEFFLQTGVEPNGKRIGVVVGIPSGKNRLHVFGSVRHPRKPLVLQKPEWDALRTATGRVHVLDQACGDQGVQTEKELDLEATPAGIRVVRSEYGCDEHNHRGMLLSTTQL